ncbi:MAG: hypothetical protein QOD99_1693, partial [Chthoniobacter sp.]|nr:hypothetical protein [Chthoniobacter sp.]
MPRWLLLVFLAGTAAFGAGPDSMRVAVRYKQILAAEPVEGMALDRLWKIAQEGSATGALIDEYKARTDTFSGAMIYGHLLRKAGRVEEAGAAYKSAAKLDVKSPLPHLALAQNFLDRGTPAEAAGEFEQGVALLSKNDPKLPDALAQLATAWLAANESAKASNALERICAANPGDLAMRQRLAEIYEKSGLASEAATHWDYIAAHGAPAERAQAFQNVARIRRGNGDVDGAIAALEQALVLTGAGNWLRPELETQIIKIHERYQRMAELEARWQKQASENPRDVAAASQLVHFYERAGDLEKERGWLETLCALAPKNVEHTAKLARVCVQTGNFDRAAALLDEALAAQPANADYVFARADVDVCRNATGTARERIEKLLDRQPGDDALTARALEWFQKNRAFEAAEAHLKRVAHDENSILELASFYFSQNKHDEAKRALQKLVHDGQSSGEQAAACGKIAEILREQSDLPAALEAIRRAVDLQPQAFQWRLTHADLLLSAQRFEDAQNEAQRGFALAGSEAEREKADQKLFQIFQSRNAEPAADRASFVRVTKRGDPLASQTRAAGSALEIFVRGLLDDANAHATAAKFLRVARWQVRMRKNREALDAARRAIALDARMPAARELAVTAARAIGQRDAAVGELRDLMELEPARKNFFLRQIGELEMELRHTGAATQIFEELAAANPGSVDALSDLALTLQQAERWPDVLATWQRALAASAPPK